MSLRDDINIPVVVVLGLVTGLIVAVAIVGTQAGYNYVTQAERDRAFANAEADGSLSLGKRVWRTQEEALAKPAAWANVEKTQQTLPLAEAKKLMIESKGAAGTVAK
jgi:hypothetical protein